MNSIDGSLIPVGPKRNWLRRNNSRFKNGSYGTTVGRCDFQGPRFTLDCVDDSLARNDNSILSRLEIHEQMDEIAKSRYLLPTIKLSS